MSTWILRLALALLVAAVSACAYDPCHFCRVSLANRTRAAESCRERLNRLVRPADPCGAGLSADLETWAGQAKRGELDANDLALLIRGRATVCAPKGSP